MFQFWAMDTQPAALQRFFTRQLLQWNTGQNRRAMPWKGEKDPYRIWVSEIILQQTRVEQGLGYYNRFIEAFPTVRHLAQAPEQRVFKLWEGLGYYSRCKNLIATGRYIANELQGRFPSSYEAILQLKGVGPYTAAAIASFAYNLPHAVVDGNVFRVLARFFGIDTPVDGTAGKKTFGALAEQLLPNGQAGVYNQALMDFGATVCKPLAPACTACPLQKKCRALAQNQVGQLPVKAKTITKATRWFHYLIIDHKGKLYLRKRPAKDIWENLYEFLLLESEGPLTPEALYQTDAFKKAVAGLGHSVTRVSPVYTQQLTHLTIKGQFIRMETKKPLKQAGYEAFSEKALAGLPFPKIIAHYLTDKKLTLNL
jgi:A/G-specific adenine glycosylase